MRHTLPIISYTDYSFGRERERREGEREGERSKVMAGQKNYFFNYFAQNSPGKCLNSRHKLDPWKNITWIKSRIGGDKGNKTGWGGWSIEVC